MPSIFISYKRDHAPSREVVAEIEALAGEDFRILRDESMELGKPWSKELYSWLLTCDLAIAIVSEEANASDWCRREWSVLAARAQVADLPLIPVHLGGKIVSTGILDGAQAAKWSAALLPKLEARLAEVRARTFSSKDFLAAHQAWIRRQFTEERVLGQEPYSLQDVYIETECGMLHWGDIDSRGATETRDPFEEQNGGRSNLVETTIALLADRSNTEAIVVQAGPGSGKSAFTLRMATHLMDLGFAPIVVRFRDLRLSLSTSIEEVIADAIRIGGAEEEWPDAPASFVQDLLTEKHSLNGVALCRAVFVLDGWDEVSLTGNVSYQAQLREWLPRLRDYFWLRPRATPVRVILTGRPSSEVGESGVLQRTTRVLTIRPIRPEQLIAYATNIRQSLQRAPSAAWSLNLERVAPIFGEYEKWFARQFEQYTREESSYGDVLGNPLLAYLSLRIISESSRDAADFLSEPTALYHELVNVTVANAGKGTAAGWRGQVVHRGGDELRPLLQEVASTITILRGETASYAELEARFQDESLPIDQAALGDWRRAPDVKNALRELVVNFYFKGGHQDFGCEFLHKSFREYLFAEAVVAALHDAGEPEPPGLYANLRFWQELPEGSAAHRLSRRLAYLTAPQWLGAEVLVHVTWLIESGARAEPDRWLRIRDVVTEVHAWWGEGVHLRHQPNRSRSSGARWLPPYADTLFCQTMPLATGVAAEPVRTTTLDAHLGFALMRITCAVYSVVRASEANCGSRAAVYTSLVDDKRRFKPGGGRFLAALVGRINCEGWRSYTLDDLLQGPIDLVDEASALTWANVKWPGARLSGLSWPTIFFVHADLRGCDLRKATLYRGMFDHADLGGADLGGAGCAEVSFRDANLAGARLVQADLSGAYLTRANLDDADVTGATFEGTKITRRVFHGLRGWKTVEGTPDFIEEEEDRPD